MYYSPLAHMLAADTKRINICEIQSTMSYLWFQRNNLLKCNYFNWMGRCRWPIGIYGVTQMSIQSVDVLFNVLKKEPKPNRLTLGRWRQLPCTWAETTSWNSHIINWIKVSLQSNLKLDSMPLFFNAINIQWKRMPRTLTQSLSNHNSIPWPGHKE